MVNGGFDRYGRPTVRADVSPPRGLVTVVTFWIDTGAVDTFIMPADAGRLQIDFNALPSSVPRDIGGASVYGHPIKIGIRLADRGTVYTYYVDALAVNPLLFKLAHPSILGVSAWSRWKMTIQPSILLMEIDPINPDDKIPP